RPAQTQALMPLRQRLVRIFSKAFIAILNLRLDPTCLGVEHQMRMFGRHRQLGIDGRSVRVDQIRPTGVPEPERTTAGSAEMALPFAYGDRAGFRVGHTGAVDAQMLPPFDRQRTVVTAEVDRIA